MGIFQYLRFDDLDKGLENSKIYTVVGHKVGRHKVGLFPIFEKVYSAIKWDSENFE